MKAYKIDKSFFILMFLICISCKSQTEVQKQKIDSVISMENKKPTFSEKDIYKKIDPNSIELIVEVVSNGNNAILCDKNYEDITILKVQKIISSGLAVVNILSNGKKFKARINKKLLINNYKSPDSIFRKGDLFKINVIEQLCTDTSKTTYLISNFKKL